jgi:hypothetical protein
MAAALGIRDDIDRWKSIYQLSDDDAQRRSNSPWGRNSGRGEVVIIFQNGISPIKKPDPAFPSLPDFVPRYNPVREAEVSLNGSVVGRTVILHDIEATAISNLKERKLAMAAKRIAGRVTKAVVADQIRRRSGNEALAFLTEVALIVSDQADTRSWSLLPRDLQIARISVDAGVHEIRVQPIGGGSAESRTVQVDAGKKVFLSFRYLP